MKNLSIIQIHSLTGTFLFLQFLFTTTGFASERPSLDTNSIPPIELVSVADKKAHVLISSGVEDQKIVDLLKELRKLGIKEVTFADREDPATSPKAVFPARSPAFKSASAVIQFHPYAFMTKAFPPDQPGNQPTVGYLQRQLQSIASTETLTLAAKALENDFASLAESVEFLRKNITLSPRRGTDFIEITARHPQRAAAAKIANALADAHLHRRNNENKKRRQDELISINEEFAKQDALVARTREDFSSLVELYGLPPTNSQSITEETILMNVQKRILQQEEACERIQKNLKSEKGPQKISELQANLKTSTEQLRHLKAIVAPTPDRTIDLSEHQHKFNTAKTEYEKARAKLNIMNVKLQEARILLIEPRDPITIHERAN